VNEWVLDYYGGPFDDRHLVPCEDCARVNPALEGIEDRVIRGGSFSTHAYFARATSWNPRIPDERYSNVGIRCARAAN
jgi:formylglycine-generating enzyme required for sulfatase activity